MRRMDVKNSGPEINPWIVIIGLTLIVVACIAMYVAYRLTGNDGWMAGMLLTVLAGPVVTLMVAVMEAVEASMKRRGV